MKKRIKIKWGNVIGLIIVLYLVISFVGMFTSERSSIDKYTMCKGYKYGVKVCSGGNGLYE